MLIKKYEDGECVGYVEVPAPKEAPVKPVKAAEPAPEVVIEPVQAEIPVEIEQPITAIKKTRKVKKAAESSEPALEETSETPVEPESKPAE